MDPSGTRSPDHVVVASVEPFAIWLHQRLHPEDERKPLVTLDERGRVRHANRRARRLGVETGMSRVGAEQHAAGLATVPADGPDLHAAWEALLEEAFRYSPRVTPVREGVLAFTGRPVEARQFADAFAARVGAAGTLEEAQLLAYVREPGEATVAEDAWRVLDPAPVYLLRGVGLSELNVERLRWLGVERIGALRRWSRAQLTAYLAAEGEALLPYLHGPRRPSIPSFRSPVTVEARYVFDDMVHEPFEIDPVLRTLAHRIAAELGKRAATFVTVEAGSTGVLSRSTRRAKRPVRTAERIAKMVALAFDDTRVAPLGVEEIRVIAAGIALPGEQGALWRHRERLARAVRELEERYPGQARLFRERDPGALVGARRFALVSAATGEPVAGDALYADAPTIAWESGIRAGARHAGETGEGGRHDESGNAGSRGEPGRAAVAAPHA